MTKTGIIPLFFAFLCFSLIFLQCTEKENNIEPEPENADTIVPVIVKDFWVKPEELKHVYSFTLIDTIAPVIKSFQPDAIKQENLIVLNYSGSQIIMDTISAFYQHPNELIIYAEKDSNILKINNDNLIIGRNNEFGGTYSDLFKDFHHIFLFHEPKEEHPLFSPYIKDSIASSTVIDSINIFQFDFENNIFNGTFYYGQDSGLMVNVKFEKFGFCYPDINIEDTIVEDIFATWSFRGLVNRQMQIDMDFFVEIDCFDQKFPEFTFSQSNETSDSIINHHIDISIPYLSADIKNYYGNFNIADSIISISNMQGFRRDSLERMVGNSAINFKNPKYEEHDFWTYFNEAERYQIIKNHLILYTDNDEHALFFDFREEETMQ